MLGAAHQYFCALHKLSCFSEREIRRLHFWPDDLYHTNSGRIVMNTCACISFVQISETEDQLFATPPIRNVHREIWHDGSHCDVERFLPEETPVAMVYDGGTYAVMMATPQD